MNMLHGKKDFVDVIKIKDNKETGLDHPSGPQSLPFKAKNVLGLDLKK